VGESPPTARASRAEDGGANIISVSPELIAKSDVLARKLGISRALLIERGLKARLAAEGRL
jgi:hypothetical protein